MKKHGIRASVAVASGLMLAVTPPAFASAQSTPSRTGHSKVPTASANAISPHAATGLQVTDLSDTLTPTDLAHSLIGSGITVSNVKFTGALTSAAEFSGGDGIIGFDKGIILSSGDPRNTIGPNLYPDVTTENDTPGDQDLSALVGDATTYDASVLEFDFVPESDVVSFQYVFASDEYNEYVNTQFNDVFGFFLNGKNVALLPNTETPVSINNVNNGKNSEYYIDNDVSPGGYEVQPATPTASLNTEMDGLTKVLTVSAPVNKGQVNHIKLAISDVSDRNYDSDVFIKAGSFSDKPAPQDAPDTKAVLGFSWTSGITFQLQASDPDGVASTEYRLNGGPWTPYSGPIPANNISQLQFRSTDTKGNVEAAHSIGLTDQDSGYHMDNVYVPTSTGLYGPINKTLNSGQDLLEMILGIPNNS